MKPGRKKAPMKVETPTEVMQAKIDEYASKIEQAKEDKRRDLASHDTRIQHLEETRKGYMEALEKLAHDPANDQKQPQQKVTAPTTSAA